MSCLHCIHQCQKYIAVFTNTNVTFWFTVVSPTYHIYSRIYQSHYFTFITVVTNKLIYSCTHHHMPHLFTNTNTIHLYVYSPISMPYLEIIHHINMSHTKLYLHGTIHSFIHQQDIYVYMVNSGYPEKVPLLKHFSYDEVNLESWL